MRAGRESRRACVMHLYRLNISWRCC